ncbi:MAG: cupin domain-containing protein [Armatimonadetes bacterium CG_4_10_14_3_um_filter_66_18]|nr:cupin domain-containing protein [Armatimonadota bacterium]OIP05982.1 MAG: cupin [Armatimonadetes bacterium CG2_30_66_41]PIU95795.1 MAG: cupin domain-containing protein [Armatimonadetes bacterium CG06_land_8_20_14_3_00_66_21]PIX36998.1 MAG: cupin domain-containing protein [Armatimonadetes bacterium CG_4_8_14_3_um_filter_66_20]PIY38439.1 MAG: cupin domain-containing protein [Armatimonadetes bacterium CG_4_10_14_3_um_filter_66_18]PIZ45854.1 MAG: cupin domain-containing protein [Armatimonadetes
MDQANTPASLMDLVAYQEGTVVSKTLLSKQTGTVTLFAFDKGQGLSEHTAPFDAMVCVLDGVVEITLGGEPVTVSQGEMIVMPANVPHALSAREPFKMMLVMIRS